MRVLILTWKDLAQIVRDRKSLLFLVIMPIASTGFLGMAFRWPAQGDTRALIGVVDMDSAGVLSQGLRAMLDSSRTVRVRLLSADETLDAASRVRRRRMDALLVIPEGYSDSVRQGRAPVLSVVADEFDADGQVALRALQGAIGRVLSSARIGEIAGTGDDRTEQALAGWRDPPFTVVSEKATGKAAAESRLVANGFEQASPGSLVQFAIFALMNAALLLVLERRTRTLQRLMTTGISRAEVIAGHALAMFILVLVQGLLLIAAGQLAFGVNYLRNPPAILAVLAALALWVSALGLLIGTIARGQEQVTLFSLIAMFVFSALGGAWFPLDVTGRTFSAIGHLLPSAWAMDGFQNVIVRGLGFSSVLRPCGIMLAYAVGFLILAIARFRNE